MGAGGDRVDTNKELRAFLDGEGRLTAWPARRKKQLAALFFLAENFEDNRRYPEKEVNALLDGRHALRDPASLRRALVDWGFLKRERDGSAYWLAQPQPKPEQFGLGEQEAAKHGV